MVGDVLYTLTIAFSLVSGTAAGLLSLLTWETLRRSPFGRAVFVLSVVMGLFTLYHVSVLVFAEPPLVVRTVKSVLFTGVAAFIWLMIWSQYRVRTSPIERGAGR